MLSILTRADYRDGADDANGHEGYDEPDGYFASSAYEEGYTHTTALRCVALGGGDYNTCREQAEADVEQQKAAQEETAPEASPEEPPEEGTPEEEPPEEGTPEEEPPEEDSLPPEPPPDEDPEDETPEEEDDDDDIRCADGPCGCEEKASLVDHCDSVGYNSPECVQYAIAVTGCPDPTRVMPVPHEGFRCAPPEDDQQGACAMEGGLIQCAEGTGVCSCTNVGDLAAQELARFIANMCLYVQDPEVVCPFLSGNPPALPFGPGRN